MTPTACKEPWKPSRVIHMPTMTASACCPSADGQSSNPSAVVLNLALEVIFWMWSTRQALVCLYFNTVVVAVCCLQEPQHYRQLIQSSALRERGNRTQADPSAAGLLCVTSLSSLELPTLTMGYTNDQLVKHFRIFCRRGCLPCANPSNDEEHKESSCKHGAR